MTKVKRRKGWRMCCDEGKVTESLENELCSLIKIVGAIFEKIKIFIFFSCELRLILGLGGKLKKKGGSRYL